MATVVPTDSLTRQLQQLTPAQRLFFDQLPQVCKQTEIQCQELATWIFYQPNLFALPQVDNEHGLSLTGQAEGLLLLKQISDQYPALRQQIDQFEQRAEKSALGMQPAELVTQLTAQLDIQQQMKQAIQQVLDQTTVKGLNAMVEQVHRRIDETASPGIVTQRGYRRLLWGMWSLVGICALLIAGLLLAYQKANDFDEGFHKYELVRYRALLPGHKAYRVIHEEIERDFNQPGFANGPAHLEAVGESGERKSRQRTTK